jgi:hypothetical protein
MILKREDLNYKLKLNLIKMRRRDEYQSPYLVEEETNGNALSDVFSSLSEYFKMVEEDREQELIEREEYVSDRLYELKKMSEFTITFTSGIATVQFFKKGVIIDRFSKKLDEFKIPFFRTTDLMIIARYSDLVHIIHDDIMWDANKLRAIRASMQRIIDEILEEEYNKIRVHFGLDEYVRPRPYNFLKDYYEYSDVNMSDLGGLRRSRNESYNYIK